MKQKLVKYRKKLLYKSVVLLVVIAYVLYLLCSLKFSPANKELFITFKIGIGLIIFVVFMKYPTLRNLTLQEIIAEDCDAELWNAYLSNKKNQSVKGILNYANSLNLIGEFDAADAELKKISIEKNKIIEYDFAYYTIKADNLFYLKKFDELKKQRELLALLRYKNKKDQAYFDKIRGLNHRYINCLDEHIKFDAYYSKEQLDKASPLNKTKYFYILYLVALKELKPEQAVLYRRKIKELGGTTFFVIAVSKEVNEHEV